VDSGGQVQAPRVAHEGHGECDDGQDLRVQERVRPAQAAAHGLVIEGEPRKRGVASRARSPARSNEEDTLSIPKNAQYSPRGQYQRVSVQLLIY